MARRKGFKPLTDKEIKDSINEGRREMEWLPRPLKPQWELLSAAERDAIVAPHLQQHLRPLGLIQMGARTWIDGSRPPVRRMFELRLRKGAGMRAQWGFSLDFVPHISGGRTRWHRPDKTAMLDVVIDPGEEVLPRASLIHGADRLHDDLKRLLPIAVERAKETWRRGDTARGLLDLVDEIREHKFNASPLDMYAQPSLAYAFLSAKVGDLRSAEQELNRYVSRRKLNNDTEGKLKKLAREYADNTEGAE
jgi:hypothetical protein